MEIELILLWKKNWNNITKPQISLQFFRFLLIIFLSQVIVGLELVTCDFW